MCLARISLVDDENPPEAVTPRGLKLCFATGVPHWFWFVSVFEDEKPQEAAAALVSNLSFLFIYTYCFTKQQSESIHKRLQSFQRVTDVLQKRNKYVCISIYIYISP